MTDSFHCDRCGRELKTADEICVDCSETLAPDYIPPHPPDHAISIGDAIISIAGRLVIGAIIWVAIAALLFASAIPYGGGGGVFATGLIFATVAIPIWALLPLLNVRFR